MKAWIALFIMSACWAGSSYSAVAPPACNKSEQSYLFNTCLMRFGVAHLRFLPDMRRSQTCMRQHIQCRAAREAITCINNVEKSRLSNDCWDGMQPTLDYMLDQYQFHCQYKDLETVCYDVRDTPIQLISKSDRAMALAG